MAADDPSNARACYLFDLFGELEVTPTLSGRPDHRMGEYVRRDLVKGCRHTKHLVGGQRARRHDGREGRMASRQGSRLVDEQCGALRQALEDGATLDDDPPPRRVRQSSDQGNRRREDERARRGYDEDSNGPCRSSRDPGTGSDDQTQDEEPDRVAVGQADKRSLRGLGLRTSRTIPAYASLRRGPSRAGRTVTRH